MEEVVKGGKYDITRGKPNISDIVIGVGWELDENFPNDLIFDFAALLLDSDNVLYDKDRLIYYKNNLIMKRKDEIIKHMTVKNVYTDVKFHDFEQIKLSLYDIPKDVKSIILMGSIFKNENNYRLSDLKELHFHIFNENTREELMYTRFHHYFDRETCLVFGRLYLNQEDEWRYENLSEGYIGDLGTLFMAYYRGEQITKLGGIVDE